MLKFRVDSIEEVEEQFRGLYKEVDSGGKKVWILQVEGAVPTEKLTESQTKLNAFRNTNKQLGAQLKTVLETIGIDADETIKAEDLADLIKEKQEELKNSVLADNAGGRKTKEQIEELVAQRVGALKAQQDQAIKKAAEERKKVEEERDRYFKQLEQMSIENAVLEAAAKRGLRPTARVDIVTRARGVFSFRDGKVRAVEEDGETPVIGPGGDELQISEWVEQMASKDAVHLFEGNSGSGASGSSGSAGRNGGHTGANPWKKDTWNVTSQMEIMRRDPVTAKRLASLEGVTLPEFAQPRR